MVEFGGLWEFGYSAPITEYDHWWSVMREFDVACLNMCPVSGISKKMVREFTSMEVLLDATELTPVFVDESSDIELRDFDHPDNALYLFGKATYSPFTSLGKGHLSVRLGNGAGMLWPHQAAAIVMYDRHSK